jgi:hypothetical protein
VDKVRSIVLLTFCSQEYFYTIPRVKRLVENDSDEINGEISKDVQKVQAHLHTALSHFRGIGCSARRRISYYSRRGTCRNSEPGLYS